jgi:hypothetical protein
MVNINVPANGCILNFSATRDDMHSLHALPLGLWLIVNPGFITRENPLQKIFTFTITSQVAGKNV